MTDVSHEYAAVQQRLLHLHKSLPWSHMSAECGVCATTIKAFANNLTHRPQYRTVSLLADYAGFRMQIMHINSLKGERIPLRRIK